MAYTASISTFFEALLGPNLKEKSLKNSFSPCWPYCNIAIL